MKITGPAIIEGESQMEFESSEDGRSIKYRIRRKVLVVPPGVTVDLTEGRSLVEKLRKGLNTFDDQRD